MSTTSLWQPAPYRAERRGLLYLAVLLTLGAASAGVTGGVGRLGDSAALGIAMLAAAAVQVTLALAVAALPARRVLLVAAAADLLLAGLWVVVHVAGLPLGATWWLPEPLSIPDLAAPVLEPLGGLLLVATLARRPARPARGWRTGLAVAPAVPLVVALAAAGALGAPDDTWLPSPQAAAAPAGRTTTLTYCSPGGLPLAMDVSEPAASWPRPVPVALYVHGGGWFLGDRQPRGLAANLAGQDGALFVSLLRELTDRGFVVASIDYRLAPLHP